MGRLLFIETGGGRDLWGAQLDYFTHRWRVARVQCGMDGGHGIDDVNLDEQLEHWEHAVGLALTEMTEGPWTILGHGRAGLVALRVVAKHPALVDAVVAVNPVVSTRGWRPHDHGHAVHAPGEGSDVTRRHWASKPEIPALLIIGTHAEPAVTASARELHRVMSASHLSVIPGGREYLQSEQPDAFNAVLERFFEAEKHRRRMLMLYYSL
jgi:pimeloyl-ACP methyl ester carboxylesterase